MKNYKVKIDENVIAINAAFIYFFIKKLSTPFEETDAFRLGIIDKDGNNLIPRSKLKTLEQKKAYNIFDIVIFNLKKLLAKLPAGKTRLGTFAAALWLMKEEKTVDNYTHIDVLSESFNQFFVNLQNTSLNESESDVNSMVDLIIKEIEEDIANSVGSGGVSFYEKPIILKNIKKNITKSQK